MARVRAPLERREVSGNGLHEQCVPRVACNVRVRIRSRSRVRVRVRSPLAARAPCRLRPRCRLGSWRAPSG
eukprot:scaffold56141_cov52-Phaeocystis_antarctica.AAC.1